MKFKQPSNQEIREKRKSPRGILAVTAIAVLLVLLVNLLWSSLVFGKRLITDLTHEGLYTTDPLYFGMLDEALGGLPEETEVLIRFCEDPDVLTGSDNARPVYFTALALQNRYPGRVRVVAEDIWKNPSSVQAYRLNSAVTIYQSNVIVASGTEFRIFGLNDFYYFDSADYALSDPLGYCGDKTLTKAILSVTSAEAPTCCLITNHGETYSDAFRTLLRQAGFRVVESFDFRRDEMPKDCRLVISSGPVTDFYAVFGGETPDGYDEIDRLAAFLDGAHSFLYFFDPVAPVLPVLEEYLAEWGVIPGRYQGEGLTVCDREHALGGDGTVFAAAYETTGLGASIFEDMIRTGASGKVLFADSGTILSPASYREVYTAGDSATGEAGYRLLQYNKNGVSRSLFDLFLAGENSTATGGGITANTGKDRLMTLTMEFDLIPEDSGYTWVRETTYVAACASVKFASDEALGGAQYANADALLSLLRTFGEKATAADNTYRWFPVENMGEFATFSDADKTTVTVLCAVVPVLAVTVAGTIVAIRRKRKS